MCSVELYKHEGEEFIEMHGYDTYDSDARMYYPAIMRTTTMDPLAEKYYSSSPYAWCGNNPVRYIDPTGMYFDDANEKRARQLEQKLDKRIAKLEKEVANIEKKGGDTGDRSDRISEMRNSKSDISDMRSNENVEFRYAKTSARNNEAGRGNPNTIKTGTNDNGHDVVTMFSDDVALQVHESRHGGQVARGEYGFDQNRNPTAGYGIDSEVSAARAQYAYAGQFNYRQADYLRNNPGWTDTFISLGASAIPMVGVNNINAINRSLIQNIGAEGKYYGRRTWLPLYQRLK